MAYKEKIIVSAQGGSTAGLGVSFTNSNGISFSNTNGSIWGSHNGITQQSTQPVAASAANGSFAFSTLSFSNLNGISFGTSAGSAITASHNGLTSQSVQTQSNVQGIIVSNTTYRTGDVSFSNANGITFGSSAGGNVVTASHNGLTTAALSNHSHNLATTTTNGSLIVVATTNSAGATFAVPPYLTTARASNDGIGLNTAQTNVTWTVNSSGLSLNAAGYAGTGTSATNASITLNSNGLAISVAAPGGGGAINVSAGTTSNNLQTIVFSNSHGVSFGLNGSTVTASTNTAATMPMAGGTLANFVSYLSFADNSGMSWQLSSDAGNAYSNSIFATPYINFSAGTTSGNRSAVTFSNANGVSFGINGGTLTASVAAAGGQTREFYNPYGDLVRVAGQVGQGTMNINPNDFPNLTMDRVYMPINITNSSNSSGSHTLSFWLGIYTRNVSTLSLVTSQSTSYGITHSGTAGSYSLYSGMRHISMGLSTSLSEGLYYVAVVSRTTSGGTNGSYSQMVVSNLNSNFLGHFSSSHNTTYQFRPGLGVYSATTSGIPNSIGISQIRGSDSAGQRPPIIIFANSTI